MGASVKETFEQIKALEEHFEKAIEIATAKIINDLTAKIEECKCDCHKNIDIPLIQDKGKEVVKPITGLLKYSYPNFRVGNEELGSSKDPGSLKWPYGGPQ